jgi:hypothetical protein
LGDCEIAVIVSLFIRLIVGKLLKMQEIDYLSFKKSKISFAFLKGWVIIFQHQFKGGPQIFVHLLKGGLPKLQTPNI